MTNSLRSDKFAGALVGLAVGDALGAPVEFGYTSKSIRASWDGEMQDHRIPKGYYTDDTAMALCLADSLLERGGYDSYDVMTRYRAWAEEGYRDAEGEPAADIGNQTRGAIESFIDQPIVHAGTPRTLSAGNGGIMRLAPAVLACADQPIETTIQMARMSSRETHYSEEAEATAEVFGAMLWRALHRYDKEAIIDVGGFCTGEAYDDIVLRLQPAKDVNHGKSMQDLGGYAVDALMIAVWGFLHFDSFEQGMLEVIRLGGDTDTNAAIYGQLAGAYYGFDEIPSRWLDDLYLRDEIRELAMKLYDQQPCKILATRFEEDGVNLKD